MRAFSLIGVLLVVACQRPGTEQPQTAYLEFARSVQRGEWKKAYARLSSPTRTAIEQKLQQVQEASGGAIREDAVLMTFATGLKAESITEVKVVEQDPERAIVAVTVGGQSKNQTLVLEQGQWRLDWTQMLQP